ncbi:MAG: hypothetical protein IMY76_06555 [Chloroflexi bacterium]|nr:hypothetical protein [Chloroflexota bacterium]
MSPRVWGYSDYSQEIKNKVAPQTKKEKRQAMLVALPWIIFVFGFPIYSTIALKSKLSNEIPIITAFLNLFVMYLLVTLGDLVILDWLIISKITPQFVIIPGTEKEDYKDFSHHYKGHVKATVVIIPIFILIAAIISYL